MDSRKFDRVIEITMVGVAVMTSIYSAKVMATDIPAMQRALTSAHMKPMKDVAVNQSFDWNSATESKIAGE